ncbi:hypothetical protein KY290_026000 [Solanum tuberosum]|uniref:Uncharacterized protein n=1 Tax=Solanum tuberosum TaxID=4113 RepID=A0ABQ7UV54_SOLTU|nr:hypothetical protein KY284_034283 [Solanum tuberosum]KAH0670587.1 hypothetical protein KY289_025080 [Solanum tuberosum]KAH0673787.1 hypothetical protein KY284_024874 [Solanum tuberosum]KAH0677077.1 hypothetical protein KY285_024878 [Solanum tuberosum]KAH0755730.1 hypothetical protein KY290_026000 [Solanum tuberosum]
MDFPLPTAQPTTRISEGGILAKYCSNSLHICRWETPVMFKTNGALTNRNRFPSLALSSVISQRNKETVGFKIPMTPKFKKKTSTEEKNSTPHPFQPKFSALPDAKKFMGEKGPK